MLTNPMHGIEYPPIQVAPARALHMAVSAKSAFEKSDRYSARAQTQFDKGAIGIGMRKTIQRAAMFGAGFFSAAHQPVDMAFGTGMKYSSYRKQPFFARVADISSAIEHNSHAEKGLAGMAVQGLSYIALGTVYGVMGIVGAGVGVLRATPNLFTRQETCASHKIAKTAQSFGGATGATAFYTTMMGGTATVEFLRLLTGSVKAIFFGLGALVGAAVGIPISLFLGARAAIQHRSQPECDVNDDSDSIAEEKELDAQIQVFDQVNRCSRGSSASSPLVHNSPSSEELVFNFEQADSDLQSSAVSDNSSTKVLGS